MKDGLVPRRSDDAIDRFLADPEDARLTGKRGYERMATILSTQQSVDRTMAASAEVLRLPMQQSTVSSNQAVTESNI